MRARYASNPKTSEKGFILVVAMIILLVMSVIGIAALSSSTMQERMAGNNRQRALAQAAAEVALKRAEDFLDSSINSNSKLSLFDGTNGLYANFEIDSNTIFSLNPLSQTISNIQNDSQWLVGNSVAVSGLSSNVKSRDPRYVIEYVGRETKGKFTPFITDNSSESVDPHIFVITAIGWGRDQNIYAVLQSTYRTGSNFIY